MDMVMEAKPNVKYYAVVNEEGKITAYYNTDVYEPEQIPKTAEEITYDDWLKFMATPHRKVSGKWEVIPPLTPEELAEIERTRPRTEAEKLAALQANHASVLLRLATKEIEITNTRKAQANILLMMARNNIK